VDAVGESKGRYDGKSYTRCWSCEDRHVSIRDDDGGHAFLADVESRAAARIRPAGVSTRSSG
jgi:hypothetical protein